MKKFSILGALLLLLATASLGLAQTPRTVSLQMKAAGGANVTGTAVITEANGGVTVSVKLAGYAATVKKSDGHIHSGTCEAGGPVVNSLTPITPDAQGNGAADTTLTGVTFASISDGKHYVQYHEASMPPGKQVSCANIPALASASGQGGAAAPTAAPATGLGGPTDSSSLLTIGLLAALVVLTAGAGLSLRAARRK